MSKYLSYDELTIEQKQQVKMWYYDDYLMNKEKRNISYGEIANIHEIIADDNKDFRDYVDMISFVEDDFI